jgi:hypothetical protein
MNTHVEQDDSAESRDPLEERARALFRDSVDGLDFAMRSRLTQARNAALAVASTNRPAWFLRKGFLTPAGVTAAAVLGAFLWLGSPMGPHAVTVADGQSLEDLDIVASSDEGGGDAMDMLQDDLDFYDWADKTANAGPAA